MEERVSASLFCCTLWLAQTRRHSQSTLVQELQDFRGGLDQDGWFSLVLLLMSTH